MRHRYRLDVVIGAIVIVALGVLVALKLSDNGGDSKSPPSPRSAVQLNPAVQSELEAAVRNDSTIRSLTAGRHIGKLAVVPWTSQGGGRMLGASVILKVRPPFDLKARKLPALVTPGPSAPPGTPALHRQGLYSAKNVSSLRTLVSADSDRVVEIVPAGSQVKVTQAHIIGPRPGPNYLGVEGS